MAEQEQTTPTERPAAPDSATGKGLQEGGITPESAAILASLPPTQADALRAEITGHVSQVQKVQREAAAERKALSTDVEKAGVLDQAMRDPEFAQYIDARQKGTLRTFFLEKAGVDPHAPAPNGHATAPTEGDPHPDDAPSETGVAPPSGPDVEKTARDVAARTVQATLAQQEELKRFAATHPDHERYLRVMKSVRHGNPHASLDDLYDIAKARVGRGLAVADEGAPAGAEAQQVEETSGETALPTSPPLPVGHPPGSSTPHRSPPATMEESWAQAKETHGIDGPFQVVYEP